MAPSWSRAEWSWKWEICLLMSYERAYYLSPIFVGFGEILVITPKTRKREI